MGVPHVLQGAIQLELASQVGDIIKGLLLIFNKTENGAITFPFASTPFTNQPSRKD